MHLNLLVAFTHRVPINLRKRDTFQSKSKTVSMFYKGQTQKSFVWTRSRFMFPLFFSYHMKHDPSAGGRRSNKDGERHRKSFHTNGCCHSEKTKGYVSWASLSKEQCSFRYDGILFCLLSKQYQNFLLETIQLHVSNRFDFKLKNIYFSRCN